MYRKILILPAIDRSVADTEANWKNSRFFFERESPVFKRQFADIAVSGQHRLGASDSDPLVLHDVKEEDFTRFLWVFYNPCVYFISTLSPFTQIPYLIHRRYRVQEILDLRCPRGRLGRHPGPRALLAIRRSQRACCSRAGETDHRLDLQDRHLPPLRC